MFGSKPGKDDTKASINSNFEFKLSEKYTNMSAKSDAAAASDDFAFGGYVPSAIASSAGPRAASNGAGSRRNVAFTDDLFETVDIFATTRPKTSPSAPPQTNAANNNPLMKSLPLPAKSSSTSDDWLDSTLTGAGQLSSRQRNAATFHLETNDKLVIEKPPLASSTVNFSAAPIAPKNTTPLQPKAESMNSSFADSIELEKPTTTIVASTNLLSNISNMQPLQFEAIKNIAQQEKFAAATQGSSQVPSEPEDGWLNNLISNKRTTKKVVNVS